MTRLAGLPGKGTFARGLHPADEKALSEDAPIEVIPCPKQVEIPLLQHTGAPCASLVKVKQEVAAGEMIGNVEAFVSAPVHSPIKGVVGMASVTTLPNGRHVATIPITAASEQPSGQEIYDDLFGGEWPKNGLDKYTPEQIRTAVRTAGQVGMGGAAFPTHVKFAVNPKKPIDTILVNGCECEPYLTADYRIMLEAPAPIITGALLAAQACAASQIVIAVEDNKPAAIAKLREAAAGTNIKIAAVHTRYPMGGERQTIKATLDREVPTGGLPLDVGVVVINVGSAAAIARAVLRGKPVTHRVVTVSGRGIKEPKNLLVPVGITYRELIDYCGGLTDDVSRIVAGGPMMGFTLGNLDVPVTKGTSGITVLTHQETRHAEETPCVRCGRCVDVCPLNLVPTKIAMAAKHSDWELARRYYITACCECGCCAYVCPAGLPLVQMVRMGKAQMPRN
jgi:electron transport complex protein RnfC